MQRNQNRFNRSEQDNDYQKGYRDGMQDAFDKSELDAYYAGVGYGKMKAKDKHIGFNSDEERREFEKGIADKDEHFKSYRAHKTLWERFLLFLGIGRKTSRKDDIKVKNRRQETAARVKKNWKGGRNADSYVIDHYFHNEFKKENRKSDREKKSSRRDNRKKQKKFIKQYKRKKWYT